MIFLLNLALAVYIGFSLLIAMLMVISIVRVGGLNNFTDYVNGIVKMKGLDQISDKYLFTRPQMDWYLVGLVVGWPVLIAMVLFMALKQKVNK